MRKIDDIGYELCKYQSGLFEHSASYLTCSSKFFYKQFMNSSLAKRMDNPAFAFESLDVLAALDELKKEKKLETGKEKFATYILSWSGYLLRYWSYTYEISSKRLFKYIKLEELGKLYEAYHSLDIEEAIKRISESKNIRYAGIWEDEVAIMLGK